MKSMVQTIALGAALVALALGVWHDYGAFTAIKRTVVAYLVAYFLAGGLGLAGRTAIAALGDPEPEPEVDQRRGRSRRRRRAKVAPVADAAGKEPAPDDEPAAAEPVHAG